MSAGEQIIIIRRKRMSEKYTYAVARIRALEVSLFTGSVIDQLIAMPDMAASLQFLRERGWGHPSESEGADELLAAEESKIWEVVSELRVGLDNFDVLSLPKTFHNLKAAVRSSCTGVSVPGIYYEDAAIPGKAMEEIAQGKNWDRLPDSMREAAQEAADTLLHTGDAQLSDMIIDRACLEAILSAGKNAKESIVRDYAEETVAVADIRTAVRGAKTGKSLEFLNRALAACGSLDAGHLARAAAGGFDSVKEYIGQTSYSEGTEALSDSMSAFERWCDNRVIETMKPQKYNPFTIGPVFAWVIARQNEIKTVRIILSGKENGLKEEAIRERVREMYV